MAEKKPIFSMKNEGGYPPKNIMELNRSLNQNINKLNEIMANIPSISNKGPSNSIINGESKSTMPLDQDNIKKMMENYKKGFLPSTNCSEDCKLNGCSNVVKQKYQFWSTQPVPKFEDIHNASMEKELNGPIVIYKDVDPNNLSKTSIEMDLLNNCSKNGEKVMSFKNIKQVPLLLPSGFEWSQIDIECADELKELYTLLSENYVEDEDNMFRFDYKPEFLQWALRPPGWEKDWHIGIRTVTSKNENIVKGDFVPKGKLLSFISAIPVTMHIQGNVLRCVEINFLCVHKKLRSKRIAPVLISEITRRVNLHQIWYAVYTAGVVLPKPCAVARYWHRSLNPKKLVEIKFSHLTKNLTLPRALKLYKLPDVCSTPGLRPLNASSTGEPNKRSAKNASNNHLKAINTNCDITKSPAPSKSIFSSDIIKGCKLLNTYLASKSHALYPVFSEAEFEYWFTPRTGVIETFVVEDAKTGDLTDLFSFYSLPSSVMNHPVHKKLFAAYSFYNVSTVTPLPKLMSDALVTAKIKGYDVFNALDLMENVQFLDPLKFGIGDGNLQYYFFNFKCAYMKPEEVALVLQ